MADAVHARTIQVNRPERSDCGNPTTDRQNARRLYAPTMMRVALVSTRWPSNVISRKREPTHRDWPERDAQCHGSKRRASDLLATLRRRNSMPSQPGCRPRPRCPTRRPRRRRDVVGIYRRRLTQLRPVRHDRQRPGLRPRDRGRRRSIGISAVMSPALQRADLLVFRT